MKKEDSIIVGKFNQTGANTIDIDKVVKRWNHLYWIAEWRGNNSFRLIKFLRKDSGITTIKTTISPEQAKELINKLNLVSSNSGLGSAFSWRREIDIEYLEEWRIKKYGLLYCNKL